MALRLAKVKGSLSSPGSNLDFLVAGGSLSSHSVRGKPEIQRFWGNRQVLETSGK